MKKLLSVLSIFALLCSLLAVPAQAAGSGSMSMGSASGKPGETVTLSVNLNSNPGLVTMTIRISYDTSVLQLTGVSDSGLLVGAQLNGSYSSPYTISWVDGATTTNNTKTGTIATFTFQILDNAKIGDSTVSLQFVDSYDTDYGANSFSAGSGKVTVKCGHSYDSWTDAGNGQHSRICSICSDKETVNHSWNSGTAIKPATCTATGTQKLTCTGCGATKEETVAKQPHSYDSVALDANTHRQTCRTCGHSQTGNHSYGNWKHKATEHFKTCTICDQVAEQAAHVPGPKATQTTDQVCTVCDRILQPKGNHVHNYEETWSSDDSSHWYACSDCSEKGSVSVHDFDDNCDPDCGTCGFTRQAPHRAAAALSQDETGHWYACSDCGEKLTPEDHVPGDAATVYSPQLCQTCGFEMAPILPHDHVYDNSGTTHQHTCPCGEVYETTAEDCTVCAGFPWMWVCIGEGILLVLLLLYICLRPKKP